MDDLKAAMREKALALGFVEARVVAADSVPSQIGDHLAAFVVEGRHGGMTWMADTLERRSSPRALWQEARSIIVVADNYGPPSMSPRVPGYGRIAAYARGRDYHDGLKKRLKRLARWLVDTAGGEVKVFTDTAPVMEKPLAAAAGLGWQGRHTNLVSRRFGSWLLLGELFTTLEITPDLPEMNLCGKCHACENACPTGALSEGRIDARRCIAYLTIEHKEVIAKPWRPLLGDWVYGCDQCLMSCPWNKFSRPVNEAAYQPRINSLRLADLVQLDDEGFRQKFSGSPLKRIGRNRFLRNVLIAIGNSGKIELSSFALACLPDESLLVRSMAVWALGHLLTSDARRE